MDFCSFKANLAYTAKTFKKEREKGKKNKEWREGGRKGNIRKEKKKRSEKEIEMVTAK